MISAVKRVMGQYNAHRQDIADQFPEFPEKVVRAKLQKLVNRKILDGCTCGCYGGFTFIEGASA